MIIIIKIISLIFIALGILGLRHTLINKNDMPCNLFGLSKDKYEVINKNKINDLLIIEGYIISIFYIILGAYGFIYKSTNVFNLAGVPILILIGFKHLVSKYIKIYKK